MFENLGWPEIILLVLVGLFIFGPEKLPKAISDGMRFIRNVRQMAANATSDLGREMGKDIQLEDLHPKTFIRKHVLSDEDQSLFRNQAEDLKRELNEALRDPRKDPSWEAPAPVAEQSPVRRRFDTEAT
ncbi:Sec-independent protein translocase subunit TatB [Longispora albida]|uniref:Sec-independent protein translocase subunit TatB n=1 Tax=Longispora albida TaxID=203523 RepID=UPI0003739F6B|nr:Sec-independent protein translocase subunit TatB [Longispora albida]